MTVAGLVLKARALGIRLESEAGNLFYEAPPGVLTAELRDELHARKAELLAFLETPSLAVRRIWEEALVEVANVWDSSSAALSQEDKDGLWADHGLDDQFHPALEEALLQGDVDLTLELVEHWRSEWLARLHRSGNLAFAASPASCASPSPSGGACSSCSDAPGAESTKQSLPAEPTGAAELDIPARQGSVHSMFAEARARLGSRDIEERSLTVWLQKHAPEIAALWPDAPLSASWFDWRRRVQAEHVAVLDTAYAAVFSQLKVAGPSRPAPRGGPAGTTLGANSNEVTYEGQSFFQVQVL